MPVNIVIRCKGKAVRFFVLLVNEIVLSLRLVFDELVVVIKGQPLREDLKIGRNYVVWIRVEEDRVINVVCWHLQFNSIFVYELLFWVFGLQRSYGFDFFDFVLESKISPG